MTRQPPCTCPDPRVFGHRSDCHLGHRFLQARMLKIHGRAGLVMADTEQARWDAPLRTEEP